MDMIQKQNYEEASKSFNTDREKIWEYLRLQTDWRDCAELSVYAKVPKDIVFKRLSELNKAGLVRTRKLKKIPTRAGGTITVTEYLPVENLPFFEVENRITNIIKTKDLKINSSLKKTFEYIARQITDRSLTKEERINILHKFYIASILMIEANDETSKENRYKVAKGSFSPIDDLLIKLSKKDSIADILKKIKEKLDK
jgi:hypothetical protein